MSGVRDRASVAVLFVLFHATAAGAVLPRPVQNERDEIYTLLAYSIAYLDWQTNTDDRRGYNIAAVLVDGNDSIVFWSRNCVKRDDDFSHHAEVLSLQRYTEASGRFRPDGYRLYTTLEPCAQCAGMATLGLVQRVVYGQTDPKSGGILQALKGDFPDRSFPTPIPSPTRYRVQLDSAFVEHPQQALAVWLYSRWPRAIFEVAYQDLKDSYVARHPANERILEQARGVLVSIETTGSPRWCYQSETPPESPRPTPPSRRTGRTPRSGRTSYPTAASNPP